MNKKRRIRFFWHFIANLPTLIFLMLGYKFNLRFYYFAVSWFCFYAGLFFLAREWSERVLLNILIENNDRFLSFNRAEYVEGQLDYAKQRFSQFIVQSVSAHNLPLPNIQLVSCVEPFVYITSTDFYRCSLVISRGLLIKMNAKQWMRLSETVVQCLKRADLSRMTRWVTAFALLAAPLLKLNRNIEEAVSRRSTIPFEKVLTTLYFILIFPLIAAVFVTLQSIQRGAHGSTEKSVAYSDLFQIPILGHKELEAMIRNFLELDYSDR